MIVNTTYSLTEQCSEKLVIFEVDTSNQLYNHFQWKNMLENVMRQPN